MTPCDSPIVSSFSALPIGPPGGLTGGGDTWATFAVACARESSLVAYCVEFEAEREDQMKKTRTVLIL
ncbi:hypothetical protein ACHAXA_005121 [Cyclostephanos tholiformis]|uniref:Uncharacterized protein n=1 Tax=Cyclostephanos tholiformis TaxID=382380 RepID=A0ABD3RXB8_9STRA